MAGELFVQGQTDHSKVAANQEPRGAARLRLPVRDQVEFCWASLDQMIDREHPARVVWEFVSRLDLSAWLDEVLAVAGRPGRNTTDPRILLALWIYATLQGVGSAREIATLCEDHLAYRWLCGGVTVNYHMLADFRSQGSLRLEELHVSIVGTLMAQGLVTMTCVAQDGLKTRAAAGKSSFRRKETLERCLAEAREQIATLKRLADENAHELSARQQSARERAAREREERLTQALEQCQQAQAQQAKTAQKSGRAPKEVRVSTTDPEARVMKMADGGYRPAYNVQFNTDIESGVIVGVNVTNAGSDGDQLPIMLDQLQEHYGFRPGAALVDGSYGTLPTLEKAASQNCIVYTPLKDEARQLAEGTDPHAPKAGDSPAISSWRKRMGTEAAKQLYRWRAQTAEWINALCRNRGLQQFLVRGLKKTRGVAVLHAITHNLIQGAKREAAAIG